MIIIVVVYTHNLLLLDNSSEGESSFGTYHVYMYIHGHIVLSQIQTFLNPYVLTNQ